MTRTGLWVLASCVAVIGAAFVSSNSVGAAFPATNGKITFESERDGNLEIYAMNPDGSDQTRLTNNTVDDYNPVWSPDGTKILFASERDGNGEIYAMDADGSNQTRLTTNDAWDYDAIWSPDGTKIAFETERHAQSCPPNPETWRCNEIYVMDADGGNQIRLTNNSAGDYDPHWSPDGTQLVFESERDGNFEIYVMAADDGNPRTNLSDHPASDHGPLWSPDGTKIAFETERDNNPEIYLMNSNGTGQTNLTSNPAEDFLADCCYPRQSWAPDSTRITFGSDRDGNDEIYLMNADGSMQTRLTNNAVGDYDPSWSPDGTEIAFERELDDEIEIYVMDADGEPQTRLTNNTMGDFEPEWQVLPPPPSPSPSPSPSPPGDLTPPETTITSGPRGNTIDRTPRFKFASTEIGSTFKCRLDSQAFRPCTSPKQYGTLARITHTFKVRATDPAGNIDATPAKRTWKIVR